MRTERTQAGAPAPCDQVQVGQVILIHGDIYRAIAAAEGATLVTADPPWVYQNTGSVATGRFKGAAKAAYTCQRIVQIADVLNAAYLVAAPNAYLLMWWTWPQFPAVAQLLELLRWRHLTGGAWGKEGALGIGFHTRGQSEPWMLLAKGRPNPVRRNFRNFDTAPRPKGHSAKPEALLNDMVTAWCPEGGTVLSLWSGSFPEGRACLTTGRLCVGAEVNRPRFDDAVSRLRAAVEVK